MHFRKFISTSENVSFVTVVLLPNLEALWIIRIPLTLHFTALQQNTGVLTCPL